MGDIRELDVAEVTAAVKDLCITANYDLPVDVYDALDAAAQTEESPAGREVLAQLVENADIAAADRVPICQDTGFAVIFAEVGQDVHLTGGDFEEAVHEGVRQGYGDGYLRKSVAEEPGHARRNTKDNTPAIIHTSIVPGDKVAPDDDGQGRRRREHELAQHAQAGAGLGGHGRRGRRHREPRRLQPVPAGDHRRRHRRHHREGHAARQEGAAARRRVTHPDPRIAAMEDELLEKINALGIGPQGLGGRTTALDVFIEEMPCHIASMPMAVNVQCHAQRHKTVTL